MSKEQNYSQALDELNDIARSIEDESIPVDELAAKLKRAAELISFCRSRLRMTEEEVSKIIGQIGDQEK
ncbi:MAG: exodeoxyribonuclease VII small subunit [Bacteroidia bacterium]|nr:exodeoxyribonuclease VII small subunit [Bacteroidia bacterium]